MDKYEFRHALNDDIQYFTAYSVSPEAGIRILLETGTPSYLQATLPETTHSCNDILFDLDFVTKINNRDTRVYIVKTEGEQYRFFPVSLATYLHTTLDNLTYTGDEISFKYELASSESHINLSNKKYGSEAYFQGSTYFSCMKGYHFRKVPLLYSKPYSTLVILPELGMIEQMTGNSPENAKRNKISLVKINGTPIEEHISGYCQLLSGKPTAPKDKPLPQPETIPTPAEAVLTAKGKLPKGDCSEASSYGVHVVQRRETLFGISRQYGVSVSELKKWNQLKSNTIHPCAKLVTLPPQPPKTDTEVAAPVTVSTKSGYMPYTNPIHIVQKGETLNAIAKKYGYTPERFKAINKIDNGQVILPGQELKTTDCVCPVPIDGTILVPYSYTTEDKDEKVELTSKGAPEAKPIPDNYEPGKIRKYHIVQEDETLESIAGFYNISAEKLRQLNNLEKAEIVIPYQKIFIE